MSSAARDLEEFWSLIDRSPKGVAFREGDEDGYHMDLLCRAGREVRTNPVLEETVNYLLTKHSMSGLLRPIVMTVSRMLFEAIQSYA